MKQVKMKSKFWLMGSVAAFIVLGSGSIAAAQSVTSYNDLAWGSGQLEGNTTKITSPNGGSGLPSAGNLIDFATGNPTAVTLTITGGSYIGGAQATQGADPVSGDAFSIFNGKVSGQGVLSYIDSAGSNLVLTFTGMDPNKLYDLTYFAHRNDDGWDRASLVTISGQDSFINTSSAATDNPDTTNYPGGVLFTGPTSTSTRLPADNDNGYVARFGSVNPGSDGTVVLTISFDGSVGEQFKGKYGSAIRLVEGGSGSGGGNPNDIDGDGKADIVWRNTNDGTVVIWLMDGSTVLSQGSPGSVSTDWTIEDVADMDGDGKADLVWRQTSGTVVVWLMDGSTVLSQGSPGSVSTDWTIEDVADMDGDGKADLVWRQTSGTVVVWLMDGSTVLSQGSPGSVSTDWTIEDVADMDGDGKADIVWRNTNDGTVVIWLMDGSTVLSQGSPGSVSTDWTIEDVADMDGDGKADIVWRNTNDGTVVIWLMDGSTVLSQGSPGSVSTDWTIEDVADMDGDGKADLVWRQTSGTVVVWLMDGSTVLSQGSPGSVSTDWMIRP